MKKMIALLLVFLLSLGVSASAEGVDIDALTHEDLLTLQNIINLKLFGTALVDGIELPQGQYEVGVDIPAGSYVITVCGEQIGARVEIFESPNEDSIYFSTMTSKENVPQSTKITLKDGQLLEIDTNYSKGTITIKTWSSFIVP